MAFDLLRHAIKMILDNIGEAIKASAVPVILLFLLAVVFGSAIPTIDPSMTPDELAAINLGAVFGNLLIMVVGYLILFGWLAVTWHRFILLGEYPGPVPAFAGKNVGAYIGQLVILFLVLIGVGLAVALAGGLVTMILPVFAALVGAVLFVLLGVVYLRLALTLPAVAVGARLGLREAWEVTKPHAGTFVGIFFLLVLLRIVMALPGLLMASIGLGLVAVALNLLASWFTMIVGVGILTTLYGHIVEGRELN